jgi:1-acyl-sn-glycerol-3-phosphate acyltransferase
LGYRAIQWSARLFTTLLYRLRVVGREKVPKTSGGLVCSNHQSYFDPLLVGSAFDRRMNFLARDTLFRNRLFGRFLDFVDSIPIDREGGGLAGLKETLRRLKRNELVVIFPEGTRTRDGNLQPLKPGVCALARRSNQPLIPMALDGAYQALPRTSKFPKLTVIAVVIGDPIPPELALQLSDDQLIAELDRRIHECFQRARAIRTDSRAR